MSKLDAAIDVAAEYAYHLYKDDGVPQDKAIAAGVSAVVRAARAHPGTDKQRLRNRTVRPSGVGFSGQEIMGAGSLLSAVGWIRNLVTGG
jgi:hypothetical protein